MSPPSPPRCLLPSLAVALVLAASPPAALGHAAFTGSAPDPGARLETAPPRVVLLFSEPLDRRLTRARLRRAQSGRLVAATQRISGRRLVLTPRRGLGRGAYRVSWRSVSTTDAHPLEGSFAFGVGVAAGAAPRLESSPLAGAGWVRALVRAGFHVFALAFAGGLLAQALLGRAGRSWLVPEALERSSGRLGLDAARAAARGRSLTADAGVAALALAAGVAAVDAAAAAGRLAPSALADFLVTGPGSLRLWVVALIAAAIALASRRPRAGALAAVGALACMTASGHAGSAPARTVALAADFSHLLAAAVWMGGAAILAATWWPLLRRAPGPARREVAARLLPAFGAVALPAFAIVVVAGAVNAAVELGTWSALWQTAYGRILMAKVLLVAAAGLAALVHSRRLRPRLLAGSAQDERRHWALVRAEPVLGVLVALAAGVLVAFPLPPRQLEAARGQSASAAACDPCPLPAPRPGELSVADLAGTRIVAAALRRSGSRLTGTLRVLDFRGRPASGPVAVPGARASACGRGCLRFARAAATEPLTVRVRQGGRWHAAALPARWAPGAEGRARALLMRAERTMRALRSVRERERVTSGPGTLATAEFRLRAPDRLAWSTDGGVRSVQIGRRQWLALRGEPWRRRDDLGGGVAFSTRSWFRWTPYARGVSLVGTRTGPSGPVTELALFDPATPVWTRLWVERTSGRVLRERLVTPGRLVLHRFLDFDAPLRIEPPGAAGGP